MTVYPRQAAAELADLDEIRRRSRRSLGEPWFPMLCFAVVAVAAGGAVGIDGPHLLLPVWSVGAAAALLLTALYYRRRAFTAGITGRGRQIWPTAVAIAVGAVAAGFVGGRLGGERLGLVLPLVVMVLGYAALGWIQRDVWGPVCAAPAVAAGAALTLAGASVARVELGFGVALLCGSATLFAVERAHARRAVGR